MNKGKQEKHWHGTGDGLGKKTPLFIKKKYWACFRLREPKMEDDIYYHMLQTQYTVLTIFDLFRLT